MIGKKIIGLSEIVLRVNDLDRMKSFYAEKLGFELLQEWEQYVFFKLATEQHGTIKLLALFDKTRVTAFGEERKIVESMHSSLHHFALEIDLNDYETIQEELTEKNIEFVTQVFGWIRAKSIFIKDPEMNIVEFICHDSNSDI